MRWKIPLIIVLLILMSIPSTTAIEDEYHKETVFIFSGIANLEIDFGNGTVVLYNNANGTNVLDATASRVDLVVDWY